MRYVFCALLSLALFAMALLSWHWEVLQNYGLLGAAPNTLSYLKLSWLSIPLVVASACVFFIPLSKFPWALFGLSVLGLSMRIGLSDNFLLILVYPYCLIVNWSLGIKIGVFTKSLSAIALFLISITLATFITAEIAQSMEASATLKSKQFCENTKTGDSIENLRARAQREHEDRGHLKWIQVFDSVKEKDGTLSMLYRGYNLQHIRTCKVEIRDGKVIGMPVLTDELQ